MIDKIWNAISKTPAKIIGNAFKINNAKVKAVSSVKPTTYSAFNPQSILYPFCHFSQFGINAI